VDVTAVEQDVPLGLLEVASLPGEAWLGGLDRIDDDVGGGAENSSGDEDAENNDPPENAFPRPRAVVRNITVRRRRDEVGCFGDEVCRTAPSFRS